MKSTITVFYHRQKGGRTSQKSATRSVEFLAQRPMVILVLFGVKGRDLLF